MTFSSLIQLLFFDSSIEQALMGIILCYLENRFQLWSLFGEEDKSRVGYLFDES